MKLLQDILILVVAALSTATAFAQTGVYPSRPIRLIAPSGAGGPVDVVCRIVAQGLSDSLGQQVVVENRVGAAGLIGTE
jgi:tripartite-type tricarboxylate transporter receptor subunit TctC